MAVFGGQLEDKVAVFVGEHLGGALAAGGSAGSAFFCEELGQECSFGV